MRKLVYIFIVLVGFASCEKYIDFDAETKQPKLVINGLINPDSTFDIHISRSLSVIDNAQLSVVETATVEIFDGNGNLFEQLTYQSDGHYVGSLAPLDEESYSIEVSAATFDPVSAETSIPKLVNVGNVDTLGVTDVNGYNELQLTIEFDDYSNERNYYKLEVYAGDLTIGQSYFYPMSIRSDDVTLGLDEDGYSTEVYFSDELFDGQTKSLIIYVEDSRAWDDFIEIRLTSITYELEQYEKTQNAYQFNLGNPFAQPVQVYSNVEGGFGIFAGYQVSRKKISF